MRPARVDAAGPGPTSQRRTAGGHSRAKPEALDGKGLSALPDLIVRTLARGTSLPAEHRDLLTKGTIEYTRQEKRLYQRSLAPRLAEYRGILAASYADLCRKEPSTPDTWATSIAFNIMSRGYATVADTLGMAVVGRRRVSEIIKAFRPGCRQSAARGPGK